MSSIQTKRNLFGMSQRTSLEHSKGVREAEGQHPILEMAEWCLKHCPTPLVPTGDANKVVGISEVQLSE